jgi:small conductance mechanosensitive channel
MKKTLRSGFLRLILAVGAFFVASPAIFAPAFAQSAAPSPLVIVAQALVGSGTSNAAPTPAAAAPSAPVANAPNAAGDENMEPQPQDTFGTETLTDLIAAVEVLHIEAQNFISDIDALTQASAWLTRQSANPRYAAYWSAIGNDLVYIVAVAFLAAMLLEVLLMPVRQRLRRRKPARYSGRVFTGLALLGLRFLSVLLFVGISLTLLDRNQDARVVRYVVLSVVYVLAVCRLVVMASRFLFAPRVAPLRLMPATAAQAASAHRWVCVYTVVIAFGYFFVDAARDVHVPDAAIVTFANLLGFVLVLMTLVLIVQKRAYVSTILRGGLSATARDLSLGQSLRLWFARRWHILATLYLILGYVIAAFGVEDGFALMLRGTIFTLLILVLMRMLFHAVNRWGAADGADGFHHGALRFLFRLVIWVAAILAAAAAWGANIPALFATSFGQRVMNAGFSIGITVVTVTIVYEVFSVIIERHLNRRDETGEGLRASARARTLLPMIRNTAFIVFALILGLVVLSAAGVNIAPLLAGAGVVGVAIGFGSQTLVKDFISGLFIVLDNVVAVGDIVKIGDFSGVVEAITVRTIRLRDENGALHILPFGDVTKITNLSRDFSYAVIDVGVAYDTDLEHAMDVIRAVAAELQDDPVAAHLIMEPVEILGIENLGDFSITIRSRIRTRPGMQRDVYRKFLLRLKQRFDKEGIDIPFPTVTNYVYQATK